jgi:hypothetical protein
MPSSGTVPSTFWQMLNWGAVDRILWMGVLCLETLCVAFWDRHAPRVGNCSTNVTVFSTAAGVVAVLDNGHCAQPRSDLANVGLKMTVALRAADILLCLLTEVSITPSPSVFPLSDKIALAFNITLINLQPSFCVSVWHGVFNVNFLL